MHDQMRLLRPLRIVVTVSTRTLPIKNPPKKENAAPAKLVIHRMRLMKTTVRLEIVSARSYLHTLRSTLSKLAATVMRLGKSLRTFHSKARTCECTMVTFATCEREGGVPGCCLRENKVCVTCCFPICIYIMQLKRCKVICDLEMYYLDKHVHWMDCLAYLPDVKIIRKRFQERSRSLFCLASCSEYNELSPCGYEKHGSACIFVCMHISVNA